MTKPVVIFLVLAGGPSTHRNHEMAQRSTWARNRGSRFKVVWLEGGATSLRYCQETSTLHVPLAETYENLLAKTLIGLRWVLDEYSPELVIRTNTSNYWDLSLVLEEMHRINLTRLYAGVPGVFEPHTLTPGVQEKVEFVSGAGIWLSQDVASALLAADPEEFRGLVDDVAIGVFFRRFGFRISTMERCNVTDYEKLKFLPQIRVKHWSIPRLTAKRMFEIHEIVVEKDPSLKRSMERDFASRELRRLICDPKLGWREKVRKTAMFAQSSIG